MKEQTRNPDRIGTGNDGANARLGAVAVVGILLAVIALPMAVQAAPLSLPPRPPMPGSESSKGGDRGAAIQLRARFPEEPLGVHWQELWTIVQWRDEHGYWHDVEGWQGTLDKVVREDGQVDGIKTWWLFGDLFGRGPFRWVVYKTQGGRLITVSDQFHLPDCAGATLTVEVALAP